MAYRGDGEPPGERGRARRDREQPAPAPRTAPRSAYAPFQNASVNGSVFQNASVNGSVFPQERVDSLRRSELPLLLPARAERGRAERFGTPWVIKEVIL
jgi:hypothetical protein